jgi:uncharacterized protein YacL
MTVEELSAICGIVTSLIFSYVPKIKTWFEALDGNIKRLLQLAVAVGVAGVIFGLSCAGVLSTFTCDWPGAMTMLRLVLTFLIANQTAYALTPR